MKGYMDSLAEKAKDAEDLRKAVSEYRTLMEKQGTMITALKEHRDKLSALVKQYEDGNDKLNFYDVVYDKKLVKYYIKPYFYNQYGIKIVGNVHETDWFLLNNDINIDDFSNY